MTSLMMMMMMMRARPVCVWIKDSEEGQRLTMMMTIINL